MAFSFSAKFILSTVYAFTSISIPCDCLAVILSVLIAAFNSKMVEACRNSLDHVLQQFLHKSLMVDGYWDILLNFVVEKLVRTAALLPKINPLMKLYLRVFLTIYTYIIGHYNSSVRITTELLSPLMLFALILDICGGTYS